MIFGSRSKSTMPPADDALPGRATAGCRRADRRTWCSAPRSRARGPTAPRCIYVAMGCFWGVERIFWRRPASSTPRSATWAATRPNPTYEETCTGPHRPRRDRPGRLRPRAVPRPSCCSRSSGRTTTRRRRTGRATTSARPTARRSTGPPGRGARPRARTTRATFQDVLTGSGLRRDHHAARARPSEAGPFYLRRGLPPAVPAQEPRRLLQPRPQRADLPRRRRQPPGADRRAAPGLSRTPPVGSTRVDKHAAPASAGAACSLRSTHALGLARDAGTRLPLASHRAGGRRPTAGSPPSTAAAAQVWR